MVDRLPPEDRASSEAPARAVESERERAAWPDDQRLTYRVGAGGGLLEAAVGLAAVALAAAGLARGGLAFTVGAVGALVLGLGLAAKGAALSSRYASLLQLMEQRHRAARAQLGGGLSAELLGGFGTVLLAGLALLGVAPTVLLPVAVIGLGATLLLATGATYRLAGVPHPARTIEQEAMRSALIGVSAGQVLLGLTAVALGVLALVLTGPWQVLVLTAVLILGAGLLVGGGYLAAKFTGVLKQR